MAKREDKHPESLDNLKSIELTGEITAFVQQLSRDIEHDRELKGRIDEAVDRLDRLRYGFRRRKTHPWPGAANFSIPQIDSDINRLKPAYVNLAFNVSPVVTFQPYGPEDVEPAKKREKLFDWRMRTKVKFFKPYVYGVDMVLGSPGQTVFRTIWKFSSRKYNETLDLEEFSPQVLDAIFDPRVDDDMIKRMIVEHFDVDMDYDENVDEVDKAVEKFRDGKSKIELTLLETVDDQPEVTALNPAKDLTVPIDTKDIQDARFVDYHNLWVRKNDIKIAMRDGKYEQYDSDRIDSWASMSKDETRNPGQTDDMVQLHETCAWFDVNGDGIDERVIVTWPDAEPGAVLRFIELPYDHGQWPYVQVKRELTEDWFYSTRGIPSLDEDFQRAISTSINQAIDNGTLLNMPERVAQKGILSNPNNRRYIPGELTETNGDIRQYETRQTVNGSQPGLFQQAQFLKSWSDAHLGQQTTGLGGQTDLPGSGERGKKTATEVEALVAMQGQAQSLDLQVFQQQMSGVYYQIAALYDQFGPEEETFQITGQPPERVSREEIQGKFNIIPNGRLDNLTPALRLRKTMFAYQIGFQNPMIKQRELLEAVLMDIDDNLSSNILKTEEDLLREQKAQLQAQQQALAAQDQMQNQQIGKQLNAKKVEDDLEIRKQILLTPIQGRKFAPN